MQTICMTAILMAACWFDIRSSRIPNQLILTGWIISLAFTVWQQGMSGVPYSIAGILATIAGGWLFYKCRAVGAGDVKLLSVLTGIHGLKRSVRVVTICIPLAAAAGLLVLAGETVGIGKRIPWKGSPYVRRDGRKNEESSLCVEKETDGKTEESSPCVEKETDGKKEEISLCVEKKTDGKTTKHRHKLILAPFLTLAYFLG